ncbi:MAG: C-terminal binding protein [Dehalococcoidales bacterium]|nr:C-terminal binding protein [Dehalococcoidales bacterium]
MAAKYKVLITDYIWPSLDPERGVLEPIGAELVAATTGAEDELVGLAADADAIMTCFAKVTTKVVEAAKNCRIIARYGIGLDNIDVETATKRGIVVTNVPAYCLDEVSDHAMMLLLGLARKVTTYDRAVRAGNWDVNVAKPLRRLRGQALGIVGLGKIGTLLAGKARPFGLRVLAYDPYLDAEKARERGAALVDFPTLLAESDFISIHAPLGQAEGTSGMFSDAEFRAMKRTARLINTARGGIVDDKALYRALKEGVIAGAGIDVLPTEPPPADSPLFELDNLILTPHSAFYSEESLIDLETLPAEEVARVLTGRRPVSPVNPQVLGG